MRVRRNRVRALAHFDAVVCGGPDLAFCVAAQAERMPGRVEQDAHVLLRLMHGQRPNSAYEIVPRGDNSWRLMAVLGGLRVVFSPLPESREHSPRYAASTTPASARVAEFLNGWLSGSRLGAEPVA